MKAAESLFDTYKNNIPVFKSVFDGNCDGAVFVDNENAPTWAVLTTADYHTFVAGNHITKEVLDNILFNHVLAAQKEKQLIVFAPSESLQSLLGSVFIPRKGFIVPRKMFLFNHETYNKVGNWQEKMPDNAKIIILKEKFAPSCLNDGWAAKLMLEGICVSTAVSMAGGGYAEIGIETNPDFRGKGYATLAVLALIERLLHESLIPCWSSWPERKASQAVAQKVGFIPQPDVSVWVWEE